MSSDLCYPNKKVVYLSSVVLSFQLHPCLHQELLRLKRVFYLCSGVTRSPISRWVAVDRTIRCVLVLHLTARGWKTTEDQDHKPTCRAPKQANGFVHSKWTSWAGYLCYDGNLTLWDCSQKPCVHWTTCWRFHINPPQGELVHVVLDSFRRERVEKSINWHHKKTTVLQPLLKIQLRRN